MYEDGGLPKVSKTFGEVMARENPPYDRGDISIDAEGKVKPLPGGISVAPDQITHLIKSILPKEFGGEGKCPAWFLYEDELGVDLIFRPDRRDLEPDDVTTHGFIAPSRRMSIEAYQAALLALRPVWRLVAVRPTG